MQMVRPCRRKLLCSLFHEQPVSGLCHDTQTEGCRAEKFVLVRWAPLIVPVTQIQGSKPAG